MAFTIKETKLNAVNMIKSHHLIIFVAIFFISFDNIRFFSNIFRPPDLTEITLTRV